VLMLRRGGDSTAASKTFQLKQTQGGWRLAQRQPQPQDQAQDADGQEPQPPDGGAAVTNNGSPGQRSQPRSAQASPGQQLQPSRRFLRGALGQSTMYFGAKNVAQLQRQLHRRLELPSAWPPTRLRLSVAVRAADEAEEVLLPLTSLDGLPPAPHAHDLAISLGLPYDGTLARSRVRGAARIWCGGGVAGAVLCAMSSALAVIVAADAGALTAATDVSSVGERSTGLHMPEAGLSSGSASLSGDELIEMAPTTNYTGQGSARGEQAGRTLPLHLMCAGTMLMALTETLCFGLWVRRLLITGSITTTAAKPPPPRRCGACLPPEEAEAAAGRFNDLKAAGQSTACGQNGSCRRLRYGRTLLAADLLTVPRRPSIENCLTHPVLLGLALGVDMLLVTVVWLSVAYCSEGGGHPQPMAAANAGSAGSANATAGSAGLPAAPPLMCWVQAPSVARELSLGQISTDLWSDMDGGWRASQTDLVVVLLVRAPLLLVALLVGFRRAAARPLDAPPPRRWWQRNVVGVVCVGWCLVAKGLCVHGGKGGVKGRARGAWRSLRFNGRAQTLSARVHSATAGAVGVVLWRGRFWAVVTMLVPPSPHNYLDRNSELAEIYRHYDFEIGSAE
jgi:hypothetical protein